MAWKGRAFRALFPPGTVFQQEFGSKGSTPILELLLGLLKDL